MIDLPWKSVALTDLEGNGLLRQQGSKKRCTKLHCAVIQEATSATGQYYGVDQGPYWFEQYHKDLSGFDMALAHNGIGYDFPVMEELYPDLKFPETLRLWDTLVMAKVIWPADVLIGPDLKLIREGKLLPHLLKSHSVKAWGQRLGIHKIDYTGSFDEWTQEMADYMMGDTPPIQRLWDMIQERIGWAESTSRPADLVWPVLTMEVENEVARIIQRQYLDGVTFDHKAAIALSCDLLNEKARLDKELARVFGSWWQPEDPIDTGKTQLRTTNTKLPQYPDVTIRRVSEKTGKELAPYVGPPLEECTEGSQFVRITRVDYQPSSRDHLGQRLQDVYGWKPKVFGGAKKDKPKVDESTLEEIPDAVLPKEIRQIILDSFVVNKTYGTLSQGAKAWIRMASQVVIYGDDRMHGDMDTSGAITRRGTHKNPNLSGTPSVRKEKVTHDDGTVTEEVLHGLKGRYGVECRSLYTGDPEGLTEVTGVDASSLELILLGHYLAPLDDGQFSQRVCDASRDAHKENAEIAGMTRSEAKTTIYLKVYGGSAFKLSLAISVTEDEVPELLQYRGLPMLLQALAKRMGDKFVLDMDDFQRAKLVKARQIILKLEANIDGLKHLMDSVTRAAERGWLKAFDGTKIHVRKPHAALNSLLQSAGAIACKLWMVWVHRALAARGLVYGRDYRQILWVHDELQIVHRPGLGPLIAEVAEEVMVKVGEHYGLRGRFRTEGKTGANWYATH